MSNEYPFKVLLLGQNCTGKTALIRQGVSNAFNHEYKPTIGVDFGLLTCHLNKDTSLAEDQITSENSSEYVVRTQFWDISGAALYRHMTRVYYRDAESAIVMADASRESSVTVLEKWLNDLIKKGPKEIYDQNEKRFIKPIYLVINKVDTVNETQLDAILKKVNLIAAKYGIPPTHIFLSSTKENECHQISHNESQNIYSKGAKIERGIRGLFETISQSYVRGKVRHSNIQESVRSLKSNNNAQNQEQQALKNFNTKYISQHCRNLGLFQKSYWQNRQAKSLDEILDHVAKKNNGWFGYSGSRTLQYLNSKGFTYDKNSDNTNEGRKALREKLRRALTK